MNEEQRKWIKRLREQIKEETDPRISFQLWWELENLLAQSQCRLDPLLRNPRPKGSGHLVEDNPYLLFGRSAQLADLLGSTMEATAADFGNVQLFDSSRRGLRIVTQHGFGNEFLSYFETVCSGSFACGEAMNQRSRVLVSDIASDPLFRERQTRDVMLRAHVRSCQSTPLINSSGKLIGVVSTHFERPRRFSRDVLKRVDEIVASLVSCLECHPPDLGLMSLDNYISGALLELRDYATRVKDAGKLAALIVEINRLLNVIETRLPGLEAENNSSASN